MIYKISNGIIDVEISDAGAELMSIKCHRYGTEYLWQGNPEFWGGRAYNLFPICGRLWEGKYNYGGKEYEMNLHGFLRKSVLTANPISESEIEFCLVSDERTLKMYPFDFDYRIRYTLDDATVKMKIVVLNKSKEVMPFALGGHPGFNVPLSGGKFEDYCIDFGEDAKPKAIYMSDTCYTTPKVDEFPLNDGILALKHSLFDRDAILLSNVPNHVTLKNSVDGRYVTVATPKEMKYLGIWHAPKKEAPYVCLEPWTSVPAYEGTVDELTLKRDMFALTPDSVHTLEWSITVG